MPRLPHSLILRAFKISRFLPLILRETRSLELATNELRWIREHVQQSIRSSPRSSRKHLLQLCKRRSRGEPLQYILGSQPFGELDIKCRPGVLIPRPETEAYTTHLAELLIKDTLHDESGPSLETRVQNSRHEKLFKPQPPELKILDVCSGSGCISLLLHSLLSNSDKFQRLKILGLDISEEAVALANENLRRNVQNRHLPVSAMNEHPKSRSLPQTRTRKPYRKSSDKGHPPPEVQFLVHDAFSSVQTAFAHFDIIISNPPYISPEAFNTETSRSVRNWEPKIALVPSKPMTDALNAQLKIPVNKADIFYEQLLHLHTWNRSKVLLMEVGDAAQAARVVEMALGKTHIAKANRFEIWRDLPSQDAWPEEVQSLEIARNMVPVKGAGKMRAVVLFRTNNVETKERKTASSQ